MEVPGSNFYECASCGAQLPSIEAVQGHACPKHRSMQVSLLDLLCLRWLGWRFKPPAMGFKNVGPIVREAGFEPTTLFETLKPFEVEKPPAVIEVPEVDLTG